MRNLKLAIALCASLIAFACPALAQSGYAKVQSPWFPQGKISGGISVTNSSAATLLPSSGQDAWICNTGTADVQLAFGPSNTISVTVAGGTTLKAGTCWTYDLKPFTVLQTYVAAISGASSTLTVETGIGTGPYQLSTSGGGGGGSVTQGTTPWVVSGTTNVGSAATTAPNLVGGTIDGTGNGNVSMWKVVSGVGFINCANCSGSGASAVDETTFVPGSPTVLAPSGGFFQTTATNNPLTNLQTGMQQFTAQRAGFVNVRNSSGAELGLTAAPFIVAGAGVAGTPAGGVMSIQGVASGTVVPISGSISNTSFAATQATASALNATVVGTGTFAVQATLQGSATTAIGKVDPNTIGLWGLAASTQNGTTPTNGQLMMGQFNTTPTTITSGNVSPFQLDANANLLVKVTNTNNNGSAVSSLSSPVVIASDQAAVAVKGNAANGSAVSGNPNLVAGSDGTNARTVATDTGGNVKTINGASKYQLVAASSTATALTGGGGGATGDYLSHCDVFPTSTSPGVVTILDNTTAIYSFPGGASSLSNLAPFPIPVGSVSSTGAWKITTGTGVSVVCTGNFT